MISLKILKDKELTIMCFRNKITPEMVMKFINSLVQEPEYNPEYNAIIDLRSADMQYDMEGLKKTLNHMLTAEGFRSTRKSAYITSSSNQVVPPMMMNTLGYEFPMKVKVHSTVESAIAWLEIEDFTPENFQAVLSTMCDR